MSSTDLAIVESPKDILLNEDVRAAAILKLEELVANFSKDVSTEGARQEIKTMAYRIARSKTAIDEAGKKETEEARKKIDQINVVRREIRAKFDGLKYAVRKPLTDWEKAEEEKERIRKELRKLFEEIVVIPRGEGSEGVRARIERIKAVDHEEFVESKAFCLQRLETLLVDVEREEREKAELDALRKKQAEMERQLAEERRKAEQAAKQAERQKAAEEARVRAEAAAKEAKEKADAEALQRKELEIVKAKAMAERPLHEPAAEESKPEQDENEDRLSRVRNSVREKLQTIMLTKTADRLLEWIDAGEINLGYVD
jgi:hypothetical protein